MFRTTWIGAVIGLTLNHSLCGAEPISARAVIDFEARPFDLEQVRLLDGPFKRAMERDRRYLLDLDPDRLLHMFRVNAGLPSTARPLGGWERPDCELRGHTLGHYLSACALMVASTGDEALRTRGAHIVRELARCQAALKGGGYLSAFPETWFDRVESLQPVWAPYYTLHKLYAGLLDMYVHCGNAQALEIAQGMAAWNKRRLDRLDTARMQRMLDSTEQGGMNEALANLYAQTGNQAYLAMSLRFNEKRYVEPLARQQDRLKGEHVNSFIPNIIGTARQYELTGQAQDRAIAEFFWDKTLFVNLFIASTLDWTRQQVRIEQQTAFPERDSTTLIVQTERPTQFDLRVRVPGWAGQGAIVRLNGTRLRLAADPGQYLTLDRTWQNGDRVEIRLPMHLTTHPMPDDPTLMAFMYGPLVLAGQLGGRGSRTRTPTPNRTGIALPRAWSRCRPGS